MGRRRRKVMRITRRTLPKIFTCPRCGEQTVSVTTIKKESQRLVKCSKCGLSERFSMSKADHPVDVYCRFTDKYYSSIKGVSIS